MAKKTLIERLTAQLAHSLADAKRAANPEKAQEAAALEALKAQKDGGEVDSVNTLSWIIATTLAAIPDALRFEVHRAVLLAIEEWLPEGSPFRLAAIAAIPLLGAELEQLLKKNNVTAKELVAKIRPVLRREYDKLTHSAPEEGDGDTMDYDDKAAEKPPTFATARAKLVVAGGVIDRLMLIADDNDRKVITSVVTQTPADDIETLVIPWGPVDVLVDDEKTDDATFLANKRVRALLATFKAAYEQGNPAPAPTVAEEVHQVAEEVMDAVTKLLHDIKIPQWLHEPLKRIMKVDVESTVDDVENKTYPLVAHALRWSAGFVLLALGLLLAFVGTVSLVYSGVTSELGIDLQVMGVGELLLRLGGAAFNHIVVVMSGAMFAGIGGFVMWPYDTRPTEPENDASEADKAEFAENDDAWREGYRNALTMRVAAATWSVTVGTSVVLIFGAAALAWQFQWVTVLMILGVVFLVGLAVLWPLDDGLTAILDRVHAIVRGHKISTTVFIAVIGGVVMYVPAVLTVPPTAARVGAFFVILLVALAAILPNRVIAGGPSDDKEVGSVIAKTRRAMAATLPFWVAGLALGMGLIALTGFGAYYAHNWSRECTGYERVPECSALESGGLHTYVDNHDRWVAMRDRSARARESAHMSVGDACTVATRKVDAMARTYAEVIGTKPGGTTAGMCVDMATHPGEWSDPDLAAAVEVCARQKAACDVTKR